MKHNIIDRYWPYLLVIASWLILLFCIVSCTKTVYVPLETTKYINHIDTLQTHDTLTTTSTTIIREVDSLALAEYGISMQNQQRAWLVERTELQERISDLSHITHDTIRDSIPIVKPITEVKTVEVEASQSWWQKALQVIGITSLIILSTFAIGYVTRQLK